MISLIYCVCVFIYTERVKKVYSYTRLVVSYNIVYLLVLNFQFIFIGSLDHLLKGSKGIFIHTRLVVSYNIVYIVYLLVFEF